MSEDDWDLVMNVHLRGAFLMSRAAQNVFVAQKFGKIVQPLERQRPGQPRPGQLRRRQDGQSGFTRTLGIELGPYGVNVTPSPPASSPPT